MSNTPAAVGKYRVSKDQAACPTRHMPFAPRPLPRYLCCSAGHILGSTDRARLPCPEWTPKTIGTITIDVAKDCPEFASGILGEPKKDTKSRIKPLRESETEAACAAPVRPVELTNSPNQNFIVIARVLGKDKEVAIKRRSL